MSKSGILQEFERQQENLIQKGYVQASGLTESKFLNLTTPLKDEIEKIPTSAVDLENGKLPFTLVVQSTLIPTESAMAVVSKEGKTGIVKLFPLKPEDFQAIEEVQVPKNPVYLLIDIDRGKESLNIRPKDAFKTILEKGRSPLTIDEGIALITQFPEFLIKNNCFSLLGSRHAGDQRVPAIWINAAKNPNLGWCWNGNPHTWLGSASCGSRVWA